MTKRHLSMALSVSMTVISLLVGHACASSSIVLVADYPAGLPPERLAQSAISNMPLTEQARLGIKAGQEQGTLLRSGIYEWQTRLNLQRRYERVTGGRFAEAQISLERGVRWGQKAQIDRRLAEQGVNAAVSGYEDAWHEAARSLLQTWFEVARTENADTNLQLQAALSADQLRVVERRVAAGDAPQLEAVIAMADLARAQAAAATARQRAFMMRVEFDRKYPALRELHLRVETAGKSAKATQPIDATQLEEAILSANHEIELAKAQTALARLRVERAQSELRADPSFGLHYGQERGGQDHVIGVSIAIPFGGEVRDARVRLALVEAEMAESREKEVLMRVGYEARKAAQAVSQTQEISYQLILASTRAGKAAELAGRAYEEGETSLTAWLQARRQASEAQLSATLAQVDAFEAMARAMLDAHQIWTAPTPEVLGLQ